MKKIILLLAFVSFASCTNDNDSIVKESNCFTISEKKQVTEHPTPDKWILVYKLDNEKVSKSVYDSYQVGQTYCK